jgi:hypothetical protein
MSESTASPSEATHKLKRLKPTQRACDELNEKGKPCFGNIKRWYDYPEDVAALVGGAKKEIYRCEFCKTIYTPDLSEAPHSFTVRY